MLKKNGFVRWVASLVLVCFTYTSVGWSAPEISHTNNFSLEIPNQIGSIQKIYGEESTRTPLVVYVQDVHANPEAQSNINHLLQSLAEQNKSAAHPRPFLVLTENASGLLDPKAINLLPSQPQIQTEVVKDLTSRGELSGVELFRLSNQSEVTGIEDSELHQRNLREFRALLAARPQVDQLLSKLQDALRRKMISDLNPKLRLFVSERIARKQNQRDLLAHIKKINEYSREVLSVDLSNVRGQRQFPNLTRLVHLRSIEQSFDFDAARREWQEFIKKAPVSKLTGDQRAQAEEMTIMFSKKSLGQLPRHPRLYLEFIAALEIASGQNVETFKNLQKSLAFLTLQTEIDALELFSELGQLEQMIENQLITNNREKEILMTLLQFDLLSKLVRGEITRDELNELQKNQHYDDIRSLDNQLFDAFQVWIKRAFHFYSGAAEREGKLVENMFSKIESREAPMIVLVAGGFHTDGVVELLKRRHISCAVVSPKISKLPETNLYRDVMLGKNVDISANTIFRTLLLSPGGDRRIAEAAYERVLRNRFDPAEADRRMKSMRSELRTPPDQASELSVGVIGLDSTGIRFMENFHNVGATVNGFDPDPAAFEEGRTQMQAMVSPDAFAALNANLIPNAGAKEGSFTDKNPGMIDFVRRSDVIIINMDPTKKKNPKDYEADIYSLVTNLAKAVQRVRKSGNGASHKKKVFVFRSIVPFRGEPTALLQRLENTFVNAGATDFEVIYQPTFLRRDPEAEEVKDEQIVLGTINGEETEGSRILKTLYAERKGSVLVTSARTAELAQYFTTLYLAKKISAFNQLTKLINKVGGDINAISLVAGLDNRLSTAYSKVGLGFSGWLKRITQVVLERVKIRSATAEGVEKLVLKKLEQILQEILAINDYQVDVLKSEIKKHEGAISGKRVVLMGIASRPDSGRFQDSPVLKLIAWFKDNGVQQVSIYDPHVSENEFQEWIRSQREADPGYASMGIDFVRTESDLYRELENAHFGVIGIHHSEIVNLDLNKVAQGLDTNTLYDGWNTFGLQPDGSVAKTLEEVAKARINYISMGRPPIGPKFSHSTFFESRLIRGVNEIPVPAPDAVSKRIAVLGTGYVGLVQGTELAELGHRVTGADISAPKIEMLNRGESPIYEPGLDDLLRKHRGNSLHFTTDIKAAVRDSQAIFIAVGTPSDTDGSIDLSYVVKAARDVGEVIAELKSAQGSIPADQRKIIIIKSTVTPDVFQKISSQLFRDFGLILGQDYALASNPEFLREGQALKDVQYPDRIAFGIDPRMSSAAISDTERFLLEMIRPRMEFLEREAAAGKTVPPVRVVITDTISAPLGKYLANSYLAADISFSNVAARAVKFLGGSWLRVARIMRGDSRIARGSFLGAGVGYGGSCFPKDVKALLSYLIRNGVPASFLTLVEDINHWVKEEAFVDQVVESILGDVWNKTVYEMPLVGKQIGIWGLAFKPDTDDVREAPAFNIILGLLNAGAKVAAHDPLPKAVANFVGDIQNSDSVKDVPKRQMLQALKEHLDAGRLVIVQDRYGAVRGSDAVALLTEWRDYAVKSSDNPNGIDLAEIKPLFSNSGHAPIAIAGRDLWDGRKFASAGFHFYAVSQHDRGPHGRSELRASKPRTKEQILGDIADAKAYVTKYLEGPFQAPTLPNHEMASVFNDISAAGTETQQPDDSPLRVLADMLDEARYVKEASRRQIFNPSKQLSLLSQISALLNDLKQAVDAGKKVRLFRRLALKSNSIIQKLATQLRNWNNYSQNSNSLVVGFDPTNHVQVRVTIASSPNGQSDRLTIHVSSAKFNDRQLRLEFSDNQTIYQIGSGQMGIKKFPGYHLVDFERTPGPGSLAIYIDQDMLETLRKEGYPILGSFDNNFKWALIGVPSHQLLRSELRNATNKDFTAQKLRAVVRDTANRFQLTDAQLEEMIHNFQAQMKRGLLGATDSLAMFQAFATPPSGNEKGTFLAIDVGGTNLRVLGVELLGNGKWAKPRQMSARISNRIKRAKSKEEFFDFIAKLISKFIKQEGLTNEPVVYVGFTFSFPMKQTGIDSGILDRWTKGFNVPGMEGEDVVRLLQDALTRKKITNVKIAALVNDTVGTLATKAYQDHRAHAGIILGTGTNGAYWERIAKSLMAINIEWGNFDGVIETPYDFLVDLASTNYGRQRLEKQISGMYLGEIVRLILKDLIQEGRLFDGQSSKAFTKPESDKDESAGFKTAFLPLIVSDRGKLLRTARLLNKLGIKHTRYEDRRIVQEVARLVTKRAARLSAMAILAVLTKNDPDLKQEHVAAIDGSLFEKFPAFARQIRKTLRELRGQSARKIHLRLAKDGSGVGAAIIAAAVSGARSELRALDFGKIHKGDFIHHSRYGVGQVEKKEGQSITVTFKRESGIIYSKRLTAASAAFLRMAVSTEVTAFQTKKIRAPNNSRWVPVDNSLIEKAQALLRQNLSRYFLDRLPGAISLHDSLQLILKANRQATVAHEAGFRKMIADFENALGDRDRGIVKLHTATRLERTILYIIANINSRLGISDYALKVKLFQARSKIAAFLGDDGKVLDVKKSEIAKRVRNYGEFSEIENATLELVLNNVEKIVADLFSQQEGSAVDGSTETAFDDSARSELRIVQRAVRLADRFVPTARFLREQHPDLVDPSTGRRDGLASFLLADAFASAQEPVTIQSQVIRVVDGSYGIDAAEFMPALETIVKNNSRLVILVSGGEPDVALNLHRALSDRLSAIVKNNGERGIDRTAQVIVRIVSDTEAGIAAFITKSYLAPQSLREKSAVIAPDGELLGRVRSELRFLNDLGRDQAVQADALIRIVNAVNQPKMVAERFGVISLSEWLREALSIGRDALKKVKASA